MNVKHNTFIPIASVTNAKKLSRSFGSSIMLLHVSAGLIYFSIPGLQFAIHPSIFFSSANILTLDNIAAKKHRKDLSVESECLNVFSRVSRALSSAFGYPKFRS